MRLRNQKKIKIKQNKRGRTIPYVLYNVRKTAKRWKYKLFALWETMKNVTVIRVVGDYMKIITKRPGMQSIKRYLYWVWWLHPNIQVHYHTAYLGWLPGIIYRLSCVSISIYVISEIFAELIGGWLILKYIIFCIICYAGIWANLKKLVLNLTPFGQRRIKKYRQKNRKKTQKYLISAVLKKNSKLVKYKYKHVYVESGLKQSKQRWTVGQTKFKDYTFSKSLTCQTLTECLDVNNYIIQHHISYYRHDVVLDSQARTLAEQESFKEYLLLGNTMELLMRELKAKNYITGVGDLVIKKIYANHCVYNHKTNTKNVLSSYVLCWVPKIIRETIPVLSLGPWVVDQKQKKPWYIAIDKMVYKEALSVGYYLKYPLEMLWISKRKWIMSNYDLPPNFVRLTTYDFRPRWYLTKKDYRRCQLWLGRFPMPSKYGREELKFSKRLDYYYMYWIEVMEGFLIWTQYYEKEYAIKYGNFRDRVLYRRKKDFDKKYPRWGWIFRVVEFDLRNLYNWLYRKYVRWWLYLAWEWLWWTVCPIIIWLLLGSVIIVFIGIVKGIQFVLNGVKDQYIKTKPYLSVPKNMRLPLKLKYFVDDKYLFSQVDRDEYEESERVLTEFRRMLHEKLNVYQNSDENLLEWRHKHFLGNIDRVLDEKWEKSYDKDTYATIWSLVEAKYPYGKWEQNKNWWQLSDVIEYRLLSEYLENTAISRENLTDQLLNECANMETNITEETMENYATNLLENCFDKVKYNKMRQTEATENLVMTLQKDMLDVKRKKFKIKRIKKDAEVKIKKKKLKIVAKRLKLNKIRGLSWPILKLYM